MRVEDVDMSEVRRRIDNGIYDKAEFDRALAWAGKHFREGMERNRASRARRDEKDGEWETLIKMAIGAT